MLLHLNGLACEHYLIKKLLVLWREGSVRVQARRVLPEAVSLTEAAAKRLSSCLVAEDAARRPRYHQLWALLADHVHFAGIDRAARGFAALQQRVKHAAQKVAHKATIAGAANPYARSRATGARFT